MIRVRSSVRCVATAIAATLALVAAGTALAAPAQAAPRDLGGVMWSATEGNAETLLSVTTEKGCAAEAVYVSATVTGRGLPAKGQVVVSPSKLLYSATKPMTLPISNAFVIYAEQNSTALVGEYELKVRCTDKFGVVSLGEFYAPMTWRTPGNSAKNVAKATFVAKNTAVVNQPDVTGPGDGLPPVASAGATTAPPRTAPDAAATPVKPPTPAPTGSALAAPPTETAARTPSGASDVAAGTPDDGSGPALPIIAIFAAFALLGGVGWWAFRRREGDA